MSSVEKIRIENKSARFLVMPGASKPRQIKGPTLQPGGNNIDRDYIEWLREHAPEGARKVVEGWFQIGWLKADLSDGATERPEGPEAPISLMHLSMKAAEIYVECENAPDVLHQWLKAERRDSVKTLLRNKIQSLGATAHAGILSEAQAG